MAPSGMTTSMVPRAAVLAAAVLLCASLLTAWRVPLFDPDEGYYPATAAESIDAGRPWDLQFNGEPRWDKPVLTYALIQSAFVLLGRSDGAARVPSAFEGAALVLAVGALAGALAGARAGGLAAVVLSTTVGVQIFSRIAHPEIALALSLGVTQLLLVWWLLSVPTEAERHVVRGDALNGRRLPILIGISMAYGVLAKGPVAIAIPALGVALAAPFVINLRARWRQAIRDGLLAGAVAIALASPWFIAMTVRHGTGFLTDTLWRQNVARYTGQLAVHLSTSPFYYVLPTIVALLPWTALLMPALAGVWRGKRADAIGRLRFCVAMMAAATFGFYSLSASKLATYILGLMPSVAVLIGVYLDGELSAARTPTSAAYRATSVLLALTAAALVGVGAVSGRIWTAAELTGGAPGTDAGALLFRAALSTAVVMAAGGALVLFLSGHARLFALTAAGVCVPLVAFLAARPLLESAYPWQRFAAQIAQAPAPVWVDRYRTPSLAFYSGRRIARVTSDADLAGVITGADGWLIVPQSRTTDGSLSGREQAGSATIVDRAGDAALVRLTMPRSTR